jgi:hypothetical protein
MKKPKREHGSTSSNPPPRRPHRSGDASDPQQPIPPDPGKSTDIEIDEDGSEATPPPPRKR